MPTFKPALAVVQSFREVTKGTSAAATNKIGFDKFTVDPIDEIHRPQLAKALFLGNRGNELAIRRGVNWALEGPLLFDQLQYWMDMAIKGGPTPVGATDPYTWTATRNATADPALKSRTFEVRLTDGTTPSDWKFPYAMAQKLAISAAENAPLRYAINGFARRLATTTLTAGQALPSVSIPPMALSSLWIDALYANLGTTQILAQLLSWDWSIETGLFPVMTGDIRTDLDFTLDETNIDNIKIAANILLLATASGQWATEKTAAEAGTLRAVQLQADVGANRQLKIKSLMRYTAGSLFPDGEKEGLQTVLLKLEGSTDDTNFIELVAKNGKAGPID